jgi:hypothetical protein
MRERGLRIFPPLLPLWEKGKRDEGNPFSLTTVTGNAIDVWSYRAFDKS